jgi:hypothetical protein
MGDGYAYVLARSTADKFAPQTFLLQPRGGSGWDEVNRSDYNFVRDVVPLGDRLIALLQYSTGPWGELDVLDLKRMDWVPDALRKPDLERLSALTRFKDGVAVGGVLKEGGNSLGSDENDEAAVAFGSRDIQAWSSEKVPRMSRIAALASVGATLYAAGVNRGGAVISVRDEAGKWATAASAPVAWHDKLQQDVDVTAAARQGPIAVATAGSAAMVYLLSTIWLNRARLRLGAVRVFVSYRRSDTASEAGRVYDGFVRQWGVENVFKDVDSMEPGSRFPAVVVESIVAADVLVCLIGTNWVGSSAEKPEGRLGDSEDWVRREVETALGSNVPIIPALVAGASFPAMPPSIAAIRDLQAVLVRDDPDFRGDLRRLIGAVEAASQQRRRLRRKRAA